MAVQPYYSVFVFWLIVLLLIGDEIQAREIVTNKDSTFVVAFPAQEPSAESSGSNKLFLTSDEDAYALITIPSMKKANRFVRLRPGGTMRVELPGSVRMTSKTGLGPKKGINIFSNSSISVYGVSMVQHSSDGFLALPLSLLSLGNEYMVVTYKPVMNSFVMVTAKHDNTDVTFHLKLSGSGEVNVEGLKYKNGDNFSVSLQALDSFQLLADDLAGSLTGTRITSTKTLSVYSGNDCANIPEKSRSCDHLLEQMTPIATWGNVFLVKSTAYRGAGDVFYILASQDQTKITIELQKPFYTTINASQFYEYQSNPGASVVIRTSKPALVVQFGKSHSVDNSKFAPFMSIVPPNDQWSNDYTLVVPTAASGAQGAPSPFKCFANLFAETRQTKEIESKPAVNIAWQPIPFSLYSSATVNLTSGQYRLYHKSPLKFFSAMFLCNADYEAYGFPAGLRIFRRSSKCQYPNMIPADRRDNDCDDRADEELLNGIDDDGDGKFDEDLATPIPVLQAPGNVVESRCYEPMYLSRIASTPPYIAFGMCNIRGDLKIVYRDVSLSSQGCYARKNRTWTLTDGCLNTIRQSQIVSTYLKEPLMVEFPRFIPSESCNYYNLGHNYDSGKPTIVSNCPGNLTITHHDVGWENMPKCSYTHSVSVNRTWIVTNGCTTVTGVQIITLKLQGHRPYVKVQNQPVLSAAGKNITLGCEISGGAPKPTVTWVMPDGQTVNKTNSIHDIEVLDDLSKRHRIKSVLDDNSLLIAGTRVRDTGIYQCVASNPLGKSTGTVNVTIHDDLIDVDASVTIKDLKFNPNLNKPILDEELDHEIIELKRKIKNQLTQVFINMTGFQEVKILGFRNGSVKVLFRVVIKKQNKDENPQVVVSKVGQRLAVTVKSGNLGDYKIVPVMELREKPPPPKNVKANEVKESTVHISWVPPDFIAMYAISGYILQYKIFGDDHWMTYDTVKGDNHRIGGLNPGTGYQIRTKAQNKYGHSEPSSSLEITTLDEGLTGTQIALIIIIPLVVIIICVVTWYIYGKRRKSTAFQRTPSDNHLLDTGVVRYSRPKDLIQINENHQWKEIDRNALELGRVLGEGEFGMVIEGKLTQKDGTVTRCAVKKLKQTATESDMKDLLNELDIMEQVGNHPNIVNLIGACAFGGPILVVVEFCGNGNLLKYLQKQSTRTYEDMTEYQIHISPRERLKIAADVANGMAHLARRRCVHRDLAARNVLLDEKFTAKVSDFGLSRDVYTDNVYEKTTGGKLPAKWMAIEALEAGMNTTQSDIWSFGVLLWEIETGGCIPYPAFSAMEMLAALKQGYRLERPSSCSISLYNIMLKCWEADPSLRPSFDGLYLDLHQLQNNTSSPSYYENMNDTEHLTETYA